MLERGELLSIEEFYELWTKWKNEVYHMKPHSGLKKQKEKYTKPIELFMYAEEKYFKAPPPKSYASILMMKAERVHVYNVGIRKFGYEYRAQELVDFIDQKVDIKWDPEDITRLYVYTTDGKKICEAVSQELLMIAPKVQQKALEEHIKMQKKQIKTDMERLDEFRTPFEERVAQHNKASAEVIGTEDLMIKYKGNKADKIVSLPQDKQFADDLKSKKQRQKQESENEFFDRKAKDALSKLKALG